MLRVFVLASATLWIVVSPAHAAPEEPQELCIITIQPSAAWDRVVVRADEVYNKTRKDQLARDVDRNGDGLITGEEVHAYENGTRQVIESTSWLGEKNLQLDYRWPKRASFHTDLTGLEGPVADRSDWLITDVRDYEFEPPKMTPTPAQHRIEGGERTQHPGIVIEVVLFRAPADWVVWAVNGTEYRREQVSLQPFNTKEFYSVDYRLADSVPHGTEIPSLGPVAALVALSALLGRRVSNLPP